MKRITCDRTDYKIRTKNLMTAPTTTTSNIHPNKLNFIEGVNLIFDNWTALTLAVQMDFGGEDTQEKAVWFRKVIVDHFDAEGKKVEPEDLEDILLDVMSREFHVTLEDFSEREIAKLLFDLFRECIRGEVALLNQLRLKAEKRKAARGEVLAQSQGVDQVEEVDEENCEFSDEAEDSDEDME